MSIPLFKPKFRVSDCTERLAAVLDSGWTGYGKECLEFEEEWRNYTKFANAHFINSNTSGLHLALEIFKREYGWSSSAEILTTPLTFVATNHTILQAGLKPRFVDVDDQLCIDLNALRDRLTNACKAVVFVGIGGNIGQFYEISAFCKENGLLLILDAAHMAGTKASGDQVGKEADCSVFSFQAVKNLPTADSGMICFNSDYFDEVVRKLSWMGIDKTTFKRSQTDGYKWDYEVNELGYKYHGNSMMAAIGRSALAHLDEDNEQRRNLAKVYSGILSSASNAEIIKQRSEIESSRHLFQIRVKNREILIQTLASKGIGTGVHYKNNLEYPMYRDQYAFAPNAAKLSSEVLSLPLYADLDPDAAHDIGHMIAEMVA